MTLSISSKLEKQSKQNGEVQLRVLCNELDFVHFENYSIA